MPTAAEDARDLLEEARQADLIASAERAGLEVHRTYCSEATVMALLAVCESLARIEVKLDKAIDVARQALTR